MARTLAANSLRFVSLALALFALVGCGTRAIRGKVVGGPVIQAVLVSQTDERLERDGIEGVPLTLLQAPSRHSETFVRLAETTSNPDGTFEFRVPADRLTGGKFRLRAEGDDIFGGTSDVYPPQEGQTVLFQVRPRAGGDAGS